ncbi:MAG: hypothetical protein ACE5EX_01805 [Phycisphaerae bacterium]
MTVLRKIWVAVKSIPRIVWISLASMAAGAVAVLWSLRRKPGEPAGLTATEEDRLEALRVVAEARRREIGAIRELAQDQAHQAADEQRRRLAAVADAVTARARAEEVLEDINAVLRGETLTGSDYDGHP